MREDVTVLKSGVEPGSGLPTTQKLYDIRLTNVRIGAVQASTGAAEASETVTLIPNGATLTFYTQTPYTQTPTGLPGTPVTQSFTCQ